MSTSHLRMLHRAAALAVSATLLAVLGSCGSRAEVADLCDDICQCEDCSDQQQKGCEAYFQGELEAAGVYGCEEDQREYLACLVEKARCIDGVYGDQDGRCVSPARRVTSCIERESDIEPVP